MTHWRNFRAVFRLVAIMLTLSLTCGCMRHSSVNSKLCAEWIDQYWGKNTKSVSDEFATYDAQTQYAVYICTQQRVHPGLLEFAEVYAKLGPAAVPTLVARLNETRDVLVVRDIVFVFSQMVWGKYYDVAGDAVVMQAIDSAMTRLPESRGRVKIEKDIRYIKMSSPAYVRAYAFQNPACNDIVLDFYARPRQEQVQALLAQDAEAQIRTVACGCEAAQPGLRALEIPLARERGASALPVLSQTLRAAATACERTVSLNLVYLTLLDPQVSPGARRELLTLLVENWDAMPADWSRAQVLQWLREGGIPAPGAPGAPDARQPAP